MRATGARGVPADVWAGLGLLVLAGLYRLGAEQIRVSPLEGGVGANGLPRVLSLVLAILALLLIARSLLLRHWLAASAAEPASSDFPEDAVERRRYHLRALGMFAIGAGYVVVLPYLGYALAIMLLIAVTALYNGMKPSVYFVLVAIGAGIFFYFMFVAFLGIQQPPGIWPNLAAMVAPQ